MSPFSNVKKLWRFVALHSKDHKVYAASALCLWIVCFYNDFYQPGFFFGYYG